MSEQRYGVTEQRYGVTEQRYGVTGRLAAATTIELTRERDTDHSRVAKTAFDPHGRSAHVDLSLSAACPG